MGELDLRELRAGEPKLRRRQHWRPPFRVPGRIVEGRCEKGAVFQFPKDYPRTIPIIESQQGRGDARIREQSRSENRPKPTAHEESARKGTSAHNRRASYGSKHQLVNGAHPNQLSARQSDNKSEEIAGACLQCVRMDSHVQVGSRRRLEPELLRFRGLEFNRGSWLNRGHTGTSKSKVTAASVPRFSGMAPGIPSRGRKVGAVARRRTDSSSSRPQLVRDLAVVQASTGIVKTVTGEVTIQDAVNAAGAVELLRGEEEQQDWDRADAIFGPAAPIDQRRLVVQNGVTIERVLDEPVMLDTAERVTRSENVGTSRCSLGSIRTR